MHALTNQAGSLPLSFTATSLQEEEEQPMHVYTCLYNPFKALLTYIFVVSRNYLSVKMGVHISHENQSILQLLPMACVHTRREGAGEGIPRDKMAPVRLSLLKNTRSMAEKICPPGNYEYSVTSSIA